MKRRDLAVGILVAVGLAAGVAFVRLHDRPVAAGNGPEIDADISAADGRMVVDGVAVDIAVEPRPARPFEALRFVFHFSENGAPLEIVAARVAFNMTMNMGKHDFRLVRDGADWVAREVVLPKCGSGSRLWFGDLEFRDSAGTDRHGRFEINLAPED